MWLYGRNMICLQNCSGGDLLKGGSMEDEEIYNVMSDRNYVFGGWKVVADRLRIVSYGLLWY